MLHPSTKKLIDRLCEMTVQRKIDWVSSDQADTLAYDTEGYRVLLEGRPATLVLCDALGNELERATPEELGATQHMDGGTYDATVETMRVDAARIARGTEDAIASVLGGLDLDGDGIPDIPQPLSLEDAPDGPAAQTYDDVEDTAGGFDALPEVSDLEDAPMESQPEEVEEVIDAAPEPDMAPFEAPPADFEVLDVDIDTPALDDAALAEGSDDIGKAVATLADQVNSDEASSAISQSPQSGFKPSLINSMAFGVVTPAMTNTGKQTVDIIDLSEPTSVEDMPRVETSIETEQALTASFPSQDAPIAEQSLVAETLELEEPAAENLTPQAIASDILASDDMILNESAETISSADDLGQADMVAETAPPQAAFPDPTPDETPDIAQSVPPQAHDMPPEDLAPPAPPAAPSPEDLEAEEKPAKAPSKRFNPWI